MAAVKKKAAAAPPKPTPAQVLMNPPLRAAAPAAPKPAPAPAPVAAPRPAPAPAAAPRPAAAPVVAAKPIAAKPTVPAKPKVGGQGRTKPNINIGEAQASGWGQTQSPRPPERAGASMAQEEWGTGTTTTSGEDATNAMLDQLFGRTSGDGGPSTAQKRAGGLQAAEILARAGRQGFNEYSRLGQDLGQSLEALYNPYYAQQEQDIGTQKQAALDFLNTQYGGNREAIEKATAAALAAIPTSTAYQNVPIVNLQQEQNPLMNALAAYGASGQAATQQSAADAQMAQQLSDLVKGSAGQMSAAQQAVMDAAKFDVTAGGTNALQQLALAKQAGEYGIGSEAQRGLSELARQRLGTQGDILAAKSGFAGKGIDALLAGLSDSATQRAKTVAEYGPAPKKQQGDAGRNLPKGGKTGKGKGGAKPAAKSKTTTAPKPSKSSKSNKPSKPSKPVKVVKKVGVR